MSKVLDLLREKYLTLEAGEMPPDLAQAGAAGGAPSGAGGDITTPQPGAGAQEGKPAPLTSKGEEYLLKMAYLALLYTPKDDEMMQIKNMFESAGIHDENAIQAEQPETIEAVKNVITNVLGTNNTTDIANQLSQVQDPQ